MALEDILKKIQEDARAEHDSLLSIARAEAASIREKARKEAEELRADLMEKGQRRAKDHADRIKVLAGLDQRKGILKEKKMMLDSAFAKAKEHIEHLPPDKYLDFLRPLILNAVESGREEIIPAATQRALFTADFVKSLNNSLGPEKGRLQLSKDSGSFSGGFILREGRRETNLTLDSLIESQRATLEPKVAKILFGEQKQHG